MKFLSSIRWRLAALLVSSPARDVLAERRRQVTAEGWTIEHDDKHTDRSLALAAALYASPRDDLKVAHFTAHSVSVADSWPWGEAWDKRQKFGQRRRLVVAGALIQAELERLDRAEQKRLALNYRRPAPPPVNLFVHPY